MNAMPTAATRSTRDLSAKQKTVQQIDSIVEVITPENIAFNYQAAGPFRRLPAWIIDMLIMICGLILLGLLCILLFTLLGFNVSLAGPLLFVVLVAVFVAYWFYGVFFETYMNGRTPGKAIMGLRALSVDGTPINAMQATLRQLFRLLDLMPLLPILVLEPWIQFSGAFQMFISTVPTGIVGLAVMALNRRYQRIGDLVAGTMVVVEERSWLLGMAQLEDERTAQLAAILPPKFRVSRDLAKALAAYVERRQYFSQARRREIARHLGQPLIRIFGLPADTSHDLLLCAVYFRSFIADRGDAQAPVPPVQQGPPVGQPVAEGIYFDPLGATPTPLQMPTIHIRE